MTRKVAIIGMGNVGSACAHHLVSNSLVDDLVLIDINERKVQADALDFEDAMANLTGHTNIYVNDYSQLKDTDIIISAVGNIKLLDTPVKNRLAELDFTGKAVKSIAHEIKNTSFSGVSIVISNPNDIMTSIFQKETGFPKEKVIGTGTLLDTARMKRAVGKSMDIDARSITGYNLGEHGNSQFTAWSTVKVLDTNIQDLENSNVDLDSLNESVRMGAFTVMAGKKYTNYGISAAAIRLMLAILNDSCLVLPVSNYRQEYKTYLSYPAIIGRGGIIEQLDLDLSAEELQKLELSANYIKENM